METFIALLRGINVSGQKLIKMDALKQSLSKLEVQKISTYVQSGNLVFQSEFTASELSKSIKEVIAQDFGFDVPILVFSVSEWERILNQNPIKEASVKDVSALYFVLYTDIPKKIDLTVIEDKKIESETFYIGENAVYLNCPDGFGRTKLNNNFFESKLKIQASTRNWKTAYHLLEMAKSIA
jgi:uncharacterized protein (DUF1697 family)